MRNPLTVPHTETLRWSWPGFVANATRALAGAGRTSRRPMLKDRLCATGVIALALLTALMCGALVITELAPYRAAAAPTGDQVAWSAAPQDNLRLGRVSGPAWRQSLTVPGNPREIDANALTIISTVINLLIFVALGLYLKWDAGRKR